MKEIKKYYEHMFEMRYFIKYLVYIGLKNKFKRSKLGILWTFVSPLCLTIIMSVVFSVAFHYNYTDYLPYVLSGILFWDLVSQSFISGSSTVMAYDSFMRQCNHPVTLYTLSNALLYTISYLISMIALLIIILITNPANIIIGLLSLPLTVVIFFIYSWCGTTISALIGVQYRDYPMAAQLVLQAVWYLSPVFFDESMFVSNPYIFKWFQINPITHMLFLLRKPFLHGEFASIIDYTYCVGFAVLMIIISYIMVLKKERNAIFYL